MRLEEYQNPEKRASNKKTTVPFMSDFFILN